MFIALVFNQWGQDVRKCCWCQVYGLWWCQLSAMAWLDVRVGCHICLPSLHNVEGAWYTGVTTWGNLKVEICARKSSKQRFSGLEFALLGCIVPPIFVGIHCFCCFSGDSWNGNMYYVVISYLQVVFLLLSFTFLWFSLFPEPFWYSRLIIPKEENRLYVQSLPC